MLLEIEERLIAPDITVIVLTGRLALGRESQRLETLIGGFVAEGRLKVIFDLSQLGYIDSAGIGLLALAAGQLKEAGGQLVLVVGGQGRVGQMVRLTQLDAIMRVCASVADATARLGGAQPSAGV